MMPRVTKALAARIALKLGPADTWDDAREEADFATGGGLDAVRLDLLTDWAIVARVGRRAGKWQPGARFWLLVHMGATIAELAAVFGLPGTSAAPAVEMCAEATA